MSVYHVSSEFYKNEAEKKPNLYVSRVLAGVVGVIGIVFVLNLLRIFTLDYLLVALSFGVSVAIVIGMQILVHIGELIYKPITKYIMLAMELLLVLTVTVLLNIHAVLAFVLPILLATQYRSHKFSRTALVCSCLCCLTAPVLSYLFKTWDLTFMTGYIETFCRVRINPVPAPDGSFLTALWQITLYCSMPQALTLLAFGVILYSVTKSGIDSIKNHMRVFDLSESLNRQLKSILSMQEKVLYSMSDIIENRDIETGSHVRRTSEIVRLITDAMLRDKNSGVTEDFCNCVIKCAPMHDLGKIAIPDTILRKPGRLTEEEYAVVKKHPEHSARIIEQALTGIEDERLMIIAKNMAKYHHERMDGKGYPCRLSGEEIPLEARIMALADVYDALVSERCYKAPMDAETAFNTIEECMGTQFDPFLNKYFVECRPEIERFYFENKVA